ncbi:MAG: NAD+ synthase [Pseudomonadota bacterium]
MNEKPALTDEIRIAVAQLNPTIGDLEGNADKVRAARKEAARLGADLVLFPELFLSGYPPEDLVLKPAFQDACIRITHDLARETADDGPAVALGVPWREGDLLHNSLALLDGGEITALRHKVELPNYGVFDEKRVFQPGPMPGPVNFRGVRLGFPICEDIWAEDVPECLMETGAEILLVPNGSPWHKGKWDIRLNVAVARVTETDLPLLYLNQICGQDELIFDGASFVLQADRTLAMQMPAFEEAVALTVWKRESGVWRCMEAPVAPLDEGLEATYAACVLGLRDYVNKNGFPGVVLGLSGGIDSALVAAMSVDALGADRVRCVMLPYAYTAESSRNDAEACAAALGVSYETIPIEVPVKGFLEALAPAFAGTKSGVTEENLQSRTRGTILMALSNKFGHMVVTTGNKSEMSVGYATLYGDMNGGFNPIKDVYKMEVYALARWRNGAKPAGALGPDGEVIPVNIIEKAPSAELRPDQTDQDSLPPYEILDAVLERLVEQEDSVDAMVADSFDRAIVERIEHLLYIAEYKRRQAAPGVKITRKNFGRDRRYPITNRFRDRVQPTPKAPGA